MHGPFLRWLRNNAPYWWDKVEGGQRLYFLHSLIQSIEAGFVEPDRVDLARELFRRCDSYQQAYLRGIFPNFPF